MAILSGPVVASCGESSTAPSPDAASFEGVWSGAWVRTSCTSTGGAVAGACDAVPQSAPLRLTLTQTGSSVEGSVEMFPFVIPVCGVVSMGGTLTLAGQAHSAPGEATGFLSNWSTTRSGDTMTGTFTLRIVADNPAEGSITVQALLPNVMKTS